MRSNLPKIFRISASAVLIAWSIGIICSRLALGAHYATDIFGGWLIGASFLGVGFALFPPLLDKRSAQRLTRT